MDKGTGFDFEGIKEFFDYLDEIIGEHIVPPAFWRSVEIIGLGNPNIIRQQLLLDP